MTRWSFMLPAHAHPTLGLVEAIGDHPTTQRPDVAPVWSRWRRTVAQPVGGSFDLDWRVLESLRDDGIEPLVYAETGDMDPTAILAGDHDHAFALLAARAREAQIRAFHEANGSGLFLWQRWPVAQIIDVQRHVGRLFHEEGAGLVYCASHRGKRNDDMLDRYPGDDVVDAVGFDEFRRRDEERPPSQMWPWAIARLATTGKPVSVYETGAEASTEQRGAWMADLGRVQGLDLISIFDYLIEVPDVAILDDWRWSPTMVRRWDALPR